MYVCDFSVLKGSVLQERFCVLRFSLKLRAGTNPLIKTTKNILFIVYIMLSARFTTIIILHDVRTFHFNLMTQLSF